MSAIILFSGGADSTAAVARAVADGHHCIRLVNVSYGSLHNYAERNAATELFNLFHIYWPHVRWEWAAVDMPDGIFKGGKSSLMGDAPMPNGEYQVVEIEGPSPTVVPFRNANLISIAVATAEKDGFDRVYIAVHASDHASWAYPDCSPEFIGPMTGAVYAGTMHKVRLVAPFIWMTKGEVVATGLKLGAPMERTWSCYRGGSIHCGQCPTCIERHKAFLEAAGVDPTMYVNLKEV